MNNKPNKMLYYKTMVEFLKKNIERTSGVQYLLYDPDYDLSM